MSAEARSRSANDNTLLSCLARPAAQARFDNPQPGAGTLPQRHARLLGSFRSVVTTELGHVVDPIAFCLYFANSASRAVAGLLLLNMVIARKPKAPHSLLWLTAIKCLERV